MQFWQVFLIMSAIAAIFIVWPAVFLPRKYKKELRVQSRADTNSEIYADHFRELEQTMVRGEISQDEMLQLRQDLEKTMVEENERTLDESERPIISSLKSRIPILVLIFVLPILVLALYSWLGAKEDWEIYQMLQDRGEARSLEERSQLSEQMILALQDRVKEKPENSQSWYLLATAAVEQGMYEEAVRAFRAVLELEPNSPSVKAELAQALFLRAGNTITPEVRKYTQEALASAPNMPTALGLAGIDAYQSGRYEESVSFWQQALSQLDPNSPAAQALSGGIERASAALAANGESTPAEKSSDANIASVTVRVSLAEEVEAKPDDAVFVFARAWQGPRMPLAIKKITVSELPATITLDQSMAMTQGMDLASFPQIELVARVSASGSAIPGPGDWQATKGPIILASQTGAVELKISDQLP